MPSNDRLVGVAQDFGRFFAIATKIFYAAKQKKFLIQ